MTQYSDQGISTSQVKALFDLVAAKVQEERRSFESSETSKPAGYTPDELHRACAAQQDGDAWLLVQEFRGEACFDHAAGRWFFVDGIGYWQEDLIARHLTLPDRVAEIYEKEATRLSRLALQAAKDGDVKAEKAATDRAKEFRKKIGILQRLAWKQAVLTRAAAGPDSLGITGDEWDRHPWLLPCSNGLVDLRTGQFRQATPADYIRTIAPTEWHGLNEKPPDWEKFLTEVSGSDVDLISFKRRLYGCALVGEVREAVVPILWGGGRNGKGSELETIAHVLGPLAGPILAEVLLDQGKVKSAAAPSPEIIALRGKRIVWASETDEGRRLSAGRVKWLTGGDTLTGREPYGRREVTFRPSHSMFLITNHRPKADPGDYALWSRVVLIPFTLSFVDSPKEPHERKRDPELAEKLKAEAPGILAWLVRGCLEWQRQGLNPPDSVKQATEQYRSDEDLIGHFIEEMCLLDSHVRVKAGVLYQAYKEWCDANGHRPISGTKFGERMKRRFESEKSGVVFYLGVALLEG